MRVMLQHTPRQMTGYRFDYMLWFTRLEKIRDDGMPQIVEPESM